MTAFCNGGISAPKLGAQLTVGVGSAYAAQLLELAAADFLWPIIPWLVVPEILLTSFCANDPPPQPTFTQAEGNALNQLQVGTPAFVSGLAKAVTLMEYLVWHDQCYCQTGTPGTTSPVPTPTGVTVVLQPVPQSSQPCAVIDQQSNYDFTALNTSVFIAAINPAPVGFTTLSGSWTVVQTVAGLTGTVSFIPYVNGVLDAAAETSPKLQWPGGNAVLQFTVQFPPGTTQVQLHVANTGTVGHYVGTLQANAYCGGNGPGVMNPCCPPDATTQATLNSILQMVTLIQRQQVPFAYVEGASHIGLTGEGMLNIQGLIGVKVTPESIPPGSGLSPGEVNSYWLDSWINWGNSDGWLAREFLRVSPQVSMPPLAGQFTQLAYSLAPQLTVDIVELIREP